MAVSLEEPGVEEAVDDWVRLGADKEETDAMFMINGFGFHSG